jgi:NAD(P)-dependent dehydrogenase (short-subunit alcohol dehydrogenase family)
VDAIAAAGGEAIGVTVDVTSNDDLAAMVAEAERRFGPIEILVNNAGMMATIKLKPFWELTDQEWDRVLAVNARGQFQAIKAVLPSLRRNGRGKIVNISSGTFFYGPAGMVHYVASKGAVIAMTRTIARELADDRITVNAITPGYTESDGVRMNPSLHVARAPTLASRMIKRDMVPEDMIGALLFLVTPDSDFVTGQLVNVDGGKVTY